jgi:hypothetical protein
MSNYTGYSTASRLAQAKKVGEVYGMVAEMALQNKWIASMQVMLLTNSLIPVGLGLV